MKTKTLKLLVIFCSVCSVVLSNGNATLKGYTERKALERQANWLRCMARRQVIYMAMGFQTKVIASIVTEGQSITLESLTCLLPHQVDQIDVKWRFLSLEGANIQYIVQNGEKYFVDEIGKDLEINDVTKRDSGFYFLNVNYRYDLAVYFIEVPADDHVDEIKLISNESDFIIEKRVIPERNLEVSHRLYDWTQCSRCDKVGIKTRLAICFVKPYITQDPIKPKHYAIFNNFFAGLPCKSKFLPVDIKNLTEVKNVKSLQLQTHCQITCATRQDFDYDFEIKDIKTPSLLISKFKTKIKLFSKKLKTLIKPRETYVFQEQYKGVILKCPGKIIPGMPVVWKRNDTLLIPQRLVRISHGRIAIDSAGRIRFQKVVISDATTYRCMSGGRHVGTVNLIVRDRFQPPNTLFAESYANIGTHILTFIVMLYISWKVLQSRHLTD